MKKMNRIKAWAGVLLMVATMCLCAGACAEITQYLSADLIKELGVPAENWFSSDVAAADFAYCAIVECDPYYTDDMVRVFVDALHHGTIYLGIQDDRLTLCVFGEEELFMFVYSDDGQAAISSIPNQDAYLVGKETMEYLVSERRFDAYRQVDVDQLLRHLDIIEDDM